MVPLRIKTLLLSVDMWACITGREILPTQPSRLTEYRGDAHSTTVETSTVARRGARASTTQAPSSSPLVGHTPAWQRAVVALAFPAARYPAVGNVPPAVATASRSTAETRRTAEDAVGFVEPRPAAYATLSLQVFLLDVAALLDADGRRAFERVALAFLAEGLARADPFIDDVADVYVTDQRLAWTRIVEGTPRTGLDVSFEIGVAVSRDAERSQVEGALQARLDATADAFRAALNVALRGGGRGEALAGPESTMGLTLDVIRRPLGLAVTCAGGAGVLAIFVSFYYLKRRETEGERNDASSAAGQEAEVQGRLGSYPIQQISQSNRDATKQQNWHDISSESDKSLPIDDASFNVSLGDKNERTDLGAINFECESKHSMDKASDVSLEKAIDGYCDACELFGVERTLTIDDLRDFDDEVRRAEC